MNGKPLPTDAPQADDEPVRWLPDFCSLPVLFALMLVAELVAVVIQLAPSGETRSFWPGLATASLFVQWLALGCALCLCKLKPTLERMSLVRGMLVAYFLMMAITATGSALIFAIDQALGWHFTGSQFQHRFVIGNVAICALIAAALLRYFYVLEQWRDRVRTVAKAQFEALQARIRPHFLFNSMNTIASLIRTRPQDAERAVEDLSDLFRAALKGNQLSTLGVELDLINRYLDIEHLRLGARLRLEWEVDTVPRELAIPALLLQPLVENAIHHGIQLLPEGGVLSVVGRRSPFGVEIVIRNPYPPYSGSPHAHNGIALANIRNRIEYHFGDRAGLEIQASNGCFTCTVRLPDESLNR